MKQNMVQVSLTTEFDSDEVLDAQILQEDPRGGRRFKEEGDFRIQLSVEGGKVKIGGLLVEKCSVPVVVWKTQNKILKCIMPFKKDSYAEVNSPKLLFVEKKLFHCSIE